MDFSCVLLCTLATLPRSGAEMFGGSCGPLASPRTCGACVRVCVCVARIREFLCMYAHVCVCSVYNKKSAVAAPFARTQVLLIHKHTHCVIYVNEIRSPNKQACVCLRASALTGADNIYENPLTEQYKTHFRRVGGGAETNSLAPADNPADNEWNDPRQGHSGCARRLAVLMDQPPAATNQPTNQLRLTTQPLWALIFH